MFRIPENLSRFLSCDIAIDLGSTNTLIFRKGRGIVINQPSVLALGRRAGKKAVAAGMQARELAIRKPEDVVMLKPVKSGRVSDFSAAREMLARYLEGAHRPWFRAPMRVIANAPAEASAKEKAAIRNLILSVGAREVYLIEEPRALALGAGLDISGDGFNMIVDIGGGVTEMAVIAEGRVIRTSSLRTGGEQMDRSIAAYVGKRHGIRISPLAAEEIKIRIGNVCPTAKDESIEVTGRRIVGHKQASIRVSAHEACEALHETVTMIVRALKQFLRSLSPRQSVDIIDRGIVLAGGGSLLRNIDLALEHELLYPFIKVRDPLTCLVRGSGDALDYLEQFRRASRNT